MARDGSLYRSSPCSSWIAVRSLMIGCTSSSSSLQFDQCSTKLAANFLAGSLCRDERESHRHHLSCGRKATARKSRFDGSKLGDTPKNFDKSQIQ